MDYSAIWRASDALITASAELQTFVRRNEDGPDISVPDIATMNDDCFASAPAKQTSDRIEAYRLALIACEDARYVLRATAEFEGHAVTKMHASRCRVIAQRCTRAIDALTKAGEL